MSKRLTTKLFLPLQIPIYHLVQKKNLVAKNNKVNNNMHTKKQLRNGKTKNASKVERLLSREIQI